MPKDRRSAIILTAVKIAVTIAVFYFAFRSVDLGSVFIAFRDTNTAGVMLALLLLLSQVWANGARLSIVSKAADIPLSANKGALCLWESLFFAQFTPSGIGGDAWRIFKLAKLAPAVANAVNSVVLDRVIGAATLVGIVVFGVFAAVFTGRQADQSALLAGFGFASAIALGLFILLQLQSLSIHFPSILKKLERFGIIDGLMRMSGLAKAALKTPQLLLATSLFSCLGHFAGAVAALMAARAMGFDPGLGSVLIIVPVALLISMIPITISGWGLREGVLAAGFVKLGASLETAAAISILYGFCLLIIGLSGGVLFLFTQRKAAISSPPIEKKPISEI